MSCAFDTDILVYATGLNDRARYITAVDMLEAAVAAAGVVPAQVLAEYFRVLTRKHRQPSADVRRRLEKFRSVFAVPATTTECLSEAASLSDRHGLQIFDAIIICAAAAAGCRVLVSEDMQHEAVFAGVTVINPFLDRRHPLLVAALKTTS